MTAVSGGIIRALLATLAGIYGTSDADVAAAINGFFDGLISGDPNKIGAAIVTVLIMLWSVWSKKRNEKVPA